MKTAVEKFITTSFLVIIIKVSISFYTYNSIKLNENTESKKCCEMNDASVDLISSKGKGSSFKVTFEIKTQKEKIFKRFGYSSERIRNTTQRVPIRIFK